MINSFTGEYRFLSNFYPCTIKYEGEIYPSTENAYQAAKTLDKDERKKFRAISAGQAKALGQKIVKQDDWDFIKTEVMFDLVEQKFSQGKLKELLLMTENQELIEGNTWGDTFWGVCKGEGQNMLGKILMLVRADLQK